MTSQTEQHRWLSGRRPAFHDVQLREALDDAPLSAFDELGFGLVTMDRTGIVTGYNADESARSGLRPEKVLGRDMFVSVAPCTNNFLVAERYHDEEVLDEQFDYVFTFVMRPTAVRLRLMKAAGRPRQYLAVQDR